MNIDRKNDLYPVVPEDLDPKRFRELAQKFNIKNESTTRRERANAIVSYAFRNSPLEGIHQNAGITDEEMRIIMLFACSAMEKVLALKNDDPYGFELFCFVQNAMYCSRWDK